MTLDQMIADRIAGLALDAPGSTTDDTGAAFIAGYVKALSDLDRGALPADTLQLARDVRLQLGMLRGLYLRDDDAGIASVFRTVERLTAATDAVLTARQRRMFWSVATA
ncbi:hypothetical protein [Paraburkholderia sp. GAS42]|uniref:hypothetical protein n=1 Tax=Paraburkholderia sp. GAS42 TaxID=3035135 RepID=UPI003D21B202